MQVLRILKKLPKLNINSPNNELDIPTLLCFSKSNPAAFNNSIEDSADVSLLSLDRNKTLNQSRSWIARLDSQVEDSPNDL